MAIIFPNNPPRGLLELFQAVYRMFRGFGSAAEGYVLRGVSIDDVGTKIPHGLTSGAPRDAFVAPREPALVWRYQEPDAKYLYLATYNPTPIVADVLVIP